MLDASLLENFINGFFGYGNLDASYWFLGMEEGGGDSVEEINRRLNLWNERGRHVTEDLVDYHHALGITQFFGDKPKLQPTWSKLIRMFHILEGKQADTEALRLTQGQYFARKNGQSCLLELLPLPSPSTQKWLYAGQTHLPNIQTREMYRNTVAPERIKQLRKLIKDHKPQVVICYGMTYAEYWKSISGDVLETIQIGKFKALLGRNENTVFVVTAHPTSTGITNQYFNDVAENILQILNNH